MNSTKTIIVNFILTFFSLSAFCQTANINKGCSPLKVNFTSSTLSKYYWDFKDGGSANDQNPEHIFTRPGTYQVDLLEGQGGRLIGSVNIKVFAEPILNFSASKTSGCSPLTTQFNSQIQVDPDITITSVLWTFGDGNSSVQRNPTHTYNNAGVYPVALSITTNYGECDKTILVDKYITVTGVIAKFTVSNPIDCNAPAILNIKNETANNPTYTYTWDFGNGTSSTQFDPKTVTYTSKGTYNITLKVKDNSGCESILTIPVSIGPPSVVFNFNDSICWPLSTRFSITTTANVFQWNFGANGIPQTSSNRTPNVRFSKSGLQNIKLTAIAGKCVIDTSFTLFVEQVDTNFTITGPDCLKDPAIVLTANNYPNYRYTWNDSIKDDFQLNYNYKSPQRDSFYRHRRDTIYQKLVIKTELGCTDSSRKYFVHLRPNAIVHPSRHEGCAPLTVNFRDISTSTEPIVRWTLIYGDGQSKTFTSNQLGDYTFTKAGEYYVKLIIENSKNCIDTSEGFFIKVGEKLNPGFKVDKTEICLGESITVIKVNTDKRIDTWHVNSDNGRFSHCWKKDTVTHRFIHSPGIFPLSVTGEYNGCPTESSDVQMIKVKGAKPNLHYMVNCHDSNRVMFTHSSIGANKVTWQFGDSTISNKDSLVHQYKIAKSYKVILVAEDSTSGCPALMDMRTVHVHKVKADLIMEDTTCAGTLLILDGRGSQDVDRDCYSGFLWKLPDARPRTNAKDTIHKSFSIPGYQEVTLVTTDINGCRDSVTKGIYVSTIEAAFNIDKDSVCFPVDLQFTDKSKSNNKIISYKWSFGDTIPNPKRRFTKNDSRIVRLIITNELNCSDTTFQNIRTYVPFTKIESNKTGVCVGDTIQFFAKDYTAAGSSLNFEWDFGIFGTSKLQNPKIVFNTSGRFKIKLNYTEIKSGCSNVDSIEFLVVKVPIAKFSTEMNKPICFPGSIKFSNESVADGPVNYFWDFGDGNTSNIKDAAYTPTSIGKHTIKLTVQSIYGCSHTTSNTYEVFAKPSGKLSVDKPFACLREPIKFTASNLIGVDSIVWEFNDGKPSVKNNNPTEHIYDKYGTHTLVLILFSNNQCNFQDSIKITVPFIQANFKIVDSFSYCPGLVVLKNLSQPTPLDTNQYSWNFGDGKKIDTSINPITVYSTLGEKQITLTTINRITGCKDIFSLKDTIEDVPEFVSFPNVFSPNNDGVNDFFTIAVDTAFKKYVIVKTLKVYNRWGQLIYNNDNPNQGWDGKIDGIEAPVEVYAYYMEVEIKGCSTRSRKGNVTLIR